MLVCKGDSKAIASARHDWRYQWEKRSPANCSLKRAERRELRRRGTFIHPESGQEEEEETEKRERETWKGQVNLAVRYMPVLVHATEVMLEIILSASVRSSLPALPGPFLWSAGVLHLFTLSKHKSLLQSGKGGRTSFLDRAVPLVRCTRFAPDQVRHCPSSSLIPRSHQALT